MEEKDQIINRVASSSLITVDLNDYYPKGDRMVLDLKDNLFQGMILKEKDFREFVKNHDWIFFSGRHVAITCTADAVIPAWAYMLVATKLSPYADSYVFGDLSALETMLWKDSLSSIKPDDFLDAKVVIKGCGKKSIPECAFVEAVRILHPYVASIMFGEPCSTVPIYKRTIGRS